jgi:bacillithiol biosynthesis cysteine-adding enzyme BshC
MSVEIERVPLKGSPLCSAYIDEYERVGSYYLAGPSTDLDSYRAVADQIRARLPEQAWQRLGDPDLTADPDVRARLDEIQQSRGFFVSTGQQAGLFVSPLFTLYKALTAARLAAQLEERLDVPVMPLFSVASEDHDWAEVNHTYLVDVENRLARLSAQDPGLEASDSPSPPIERIALTGDIETVFDSLVQHTPDSEFKSSLLEPLRDAYRPGRSFAEAFQIALAHLLRGRPFLITRTAHPYVKRATRDLLWAEWEKRVDSQSALLARREALSAAGFEPQVPVQTGTTNLFFEGSLGRDRILDDDGNARLRRSSERYTASELRRVLEETPERVSPGALLRPVTEAWTFPMLAYVGGPAEVAYLAQSQVLFALHGIAAPVVVPRAAFRLIEGKVAKVLGKYELAADDLSGDVTAAINRIIKDQTPLELRASLDGLRRSVGEALDRVEARALEFDPGARSALEVGKKAVLRSIETLESKLQARAREKDQVMQRQLEKAAVNLFPKGAPQERLLNPYPFLIRYGESLLDEVYESVVTPLG